MAIDAREAADPLGRAMDDYQRDRLGTLTYRDGADARDGNVREFYFTPPEEWADGTIAILGRLADRGGPIVDVGCGAGQHALYLQERSVDVVAIDVSPGAVGAARERGVEDVRIADMFDLPFETDRFRSLHAVGTQLGLAGSLAGIADLLAEFARVTDDRAIAVVDNYDPRFVDEGLLGYRPDPREGIAHRCFHFEYEPPDEAAESVDGTDGDTVRVIGRALHFLLCSPDRLREAAIGTPWTIDEIVRREPASGYYRVALEKSRSKSDS